MVDAPGRALVLGLGRFGGGLAATRYLHRHGWRVRVGDAADADRLAEPLAALRALEGVEARPGEDGPELLEGVDLLVVNPAIHPAHPTLLAARQRGIRTTQELSLFLENFSGEVLLVTGTNGKSTTATLLAAAFEADGRRCLLGGNIGRSLLDEEDAWPTARTAVVEISSFQAERLSGREPGVRGTVITRVTEDHLDRHGTLAAYRAAKARAAAQATGFVAHLDDDPVAATFSVSGRRILCGPKGMPAGGCGWEEDQLMLERADGAVGPVVHADEVQLVGRFHRENLALAAAGAAAAGVRTEAITEGLRTTRPLPFRLQVLAQSQGVTLYDNAVSTGLESTLSAVEALPAPLRWVGGGKSKDGDFARVAVALRERIASAHLFGASAQPMAAAFGQSLPCTVHSTLDQALRAACDRAQPGDGILFSPGFASFDQFVNFRERGEAFHRWAATYFRAEIGNRKPDAGVSGTAFAEHPESDPGAASERDPSSRAADVESS